MENNYDLVCKYPLFRYYYSQVSFISSWASRLFQVERLVYYKFHAPVHAPL